jgi:hypothetical protein
MAKRVPVWHGTFYKKGTIRYLSFKVAGAHGSRPVIRLKKNRNQRPEIPVIPQLALNACWLDPKISQMTAFLLNGQPTGNRLSFNSIRV